MIARFASVLLLVLACAAPASGTTVFYAGLEDLTRTSALVFHGRVDSVATRNLGTDSAPRIVTETTFAVTRVLKGVTPGPSITVRQVGGTWNGKTLRIPGQPAFEAGEEVVIFLEWIGSQYVVCGMSQGVYRITRNAEGHAVARRNLGDLFIVRKAVKGRPEVTTPPPVEQDVRLDELLQRIRDTAR
jgi:hypothetical protein